MKHILMIEEDGKIAMLAAAQLTEMECHVQHAGTGTEGLAFALQNHYDLIILDLLLPDTNGVALSRQLRKEQIHTPVMMLTVKQEEPDKIEVPEGSAEDYLAKPFSMGEFIARVKAMLRSAEIQQSGEKEQDVLTRGPLVLDKVNRKIMLDGVELDFSFKEFDLLHLFMASPGKTFSREYLLGAVWGSGFTGFEHMVETHISHIRARIEEDPLHPKYILTTWGVGFRFSDEF